MNSSPQNSEPTKLVYGLNGRPPPGPNGFIWVCGKLLYSNRDNEEITPTSAQWENLWRVCDEIDVWHWPPSLGDTKVFDGLTWTLELEIGTRRVVSNGQVHGSPPGYEEKIMRLHQAFQEMAGWRAQNENG